MSSFPTVQLQGPRLMKQPAVTQVYQEQRTILPEPNIQISQGIDWSSIGKSAADLAINVVQGMREDEFALKASAMQKDQNDTERAIKAAVRINDFASVDTIRGEYKKRTANMVGGDPDDDTFVGTNMAQRKLLNQTRGFNASLDSYLEESKFGWQETIEEDAYGTFQVDTQKQILENPSYVDTAIEENDRLWKNISGQEDMSAPIKTVGLSASKRRLLFQIQKYGIDLRETKEKMTAAPKTVADVLTNKRQVFALVKDTLDRAEKLVKDANEIESKKDLSDEERNKALELRTQALTLQKFSFDSYRQNVGGLVLAVQGEVNAGMPDDFVGPPETLPGFNNPFSLEAMETMLSIGGFKPEDATALRNAFGAIENLNGMQDFSVFRATRDSNRNQVMSRADSILSRAKADIAKLDEGIRKAGDNPHIVNQLTFVRENLIQKLHSDLYYETIDPVIPESYKVSRRLQEFVGRGNNNPLMAFVGKGNVLLPFDQAGSYEMASILSSDRFGNIGDVYLDVQKKYNAVIATTSDVPRPVGGSRSGELTQRDKDAIDAHLYFSGQRPDENVTADRMQRFALIQAAKMTPVDETGYLPHLSKILSGEVKVDSTVPFDRAGFMMTPWYDQMIDMVSKAGNADDARAIISSVEKTFKADTVGDLGYTTPEPTKRSVLKLFERAGDLGTLEHLFMFSHDDTRAHILNELKPSAKISASYIARLRGLHDRYKKDGQQASPQIFLDTVGREDRYSAETQGTVTLVENRLTALGTKKVTAGATDSEKIDDANRTFIDDKLIPAIVERLGPSFGLTEETASMMVVKDAFKQTFLRDILENASIDKATGKIDASQLDALAVTAAREISSYGYNYERGGFHRSYVDRTPKQETTLNSDIFEDNTGSDPGVGQRLPMFLAMQPSSFSTYSPDFVGPPEDDMEKMNLETSAYTSKKLSFSQMDAFKRMAQDKPFESLVFLSMYRSQLSNVSDEGMLNAVTATVDGMPKDNLTLLSVSAASRLIGVDALDTEYAGRLKDLAVSIRSSLESKDGRYKISVINAPNNYGGKGSHPTVRIVDDSGKVLSSIQPRQHNFNKLNESLTQYPEKDLLSVIQSGDAAEWLKKESAKEYLSKTNSKFVIGSPIEITGGRISSSYRKVYFTVENEKLNKTDFYVVDANVGGPNEYSEIPNTRVLIGSTGGVKKKTQDELWSMSQPSGRSGETITGKPYWLPNDMRNTALEPGNLPIGSATLFADTKIDKDNPLNVEVRRYKGRFYVVPKNSKDTSQHFGVLNNIEDANKYVESMKRFLSSSARSLRQGEQTVSTAKERIQNSTDKVVDDIPFTLEQTQTIKQVYERVYGVEGAKTRIEQAMERQKKNNTRTLAIPPNYEDATAYPYYRPTNKDEKLSVKGQAQRPDNKKENTFVILSSKNHAKEDTVLHEAIHTTQDRWTSSVSSIFTQEEVDAMTPDEYYVLNKMEIPAWIGGLKARYYEETKKELLPNSDKKDYEEFLSWMETKTKDEAQGVYIKALYDLFTKDSPRKEIANETLRQVAFNLPSTNSAMA